MTLFEIEHINTKFSLSMYIIYILPSLLIVTQLPQYDQWGEIIIPGDSTFARNTSSSSLRHSRPQVPTPDLDPTLNDQMPLEKEEGSYMSQYAI